MVIMVCVAGLAPRSSTPVWHWRGLDGRALGSFLTGASHVIAKPFLFFFSESSTRPSRGSATTSSPSWWSVSHDYPGHGHAALALQRRGDQQAGPCAALGNRYLSSFIAVVAIGYFALMKIGGKRPV
jgi:hypothetical protein